MIYLQFIICNVLVQVNIQNIRCSFIKDEVLFVLYTEIYQRCVEVLAGFVSGVVRRNFASNFFV